MRKDRATVTFMCDECEATEQATYPLREAVALSDTAASKHKCPCGGWLEFAGSYTPAQPQDDALPRRRFATLRPRNED